MKGDGVIHYHGLPITPATAAVAAVGAGHAFVSFAHPDQLGLAVDVCQTFAVDNGAFSAWRNGTPVADWRPYYRWAEGAAKAPGFDFAVIPDVIDGCEDENDALLAEWPLSRWLGAPVWHMHESMDRLVRLRARWPRVCIGSSGPYARVGSVAWWGRMAQAMNVLCDDAGRPTCRIHGLRMLDPSVFQRLPLASADSTNIGRNVGIDSRWGGSYTPPTKEARAAVLRARIEAHNSPPTWTGAPTQSGVQGSLWPDADIAHDGASA